MKGAMKITLWSFWCPTRIEPIKCRKSSRRDSIHLLFTKKIRGDRVMKINLLIRFVYPDEAFFLIDADWLVIIIKPG